VSQAIQYDPVTRTNPHIAPRHNRPSSRRRGPDQATCRTESGFQAAGGYTNQTQNVAALKRARDQDLAVHPGQDIEYVIGDDDKSSRDRFALDHERGEPTTPRTTRRSWSELSRACFHRSGGTAPTSDESSTEHV